MKIATYFRLVFFSEGLINTKNNDPISGKIIKDERIGNMLFNN
tara:strand:+ start:1647 stop:1775 length:129 start_codon:yes stop_codon:yes gene_type:complete